MIMKVHPLSKKSIIGYLNNGKTIIGYLNNTFKVWNNFNLIESVLSRVGAKKGIRPMARNKTVI